MLPGHTPHDHSPHYPHYYSQHPIDVDALAAGVQRHMPPNQTYFNLPGIDPATVDFRTFPYNPSEVKHRKRTTRPQQKVLEDTFKRETKPNANLRKTLAAELGMTPRGVQVWFQNRRAKEKALAKKARSGNNNKPLSLDSRDDGDQDQDDSPNSPPSSAVTNEQDSPSTADQPLTESPDESPQARLPTLSPIETVTATSANEDLAPKRESGPSPAGLGLSRTSWNTPPRSAGEMGRSSTENSPPPVEDDAIVSLRRGSLPTHVGTGVNHPPPPSAFRVRSTGGGMGGSIGPGGMVGYDPFSRRLSLDRLASHPYAHVALAANGAVFGPQRHVSHPHTRLSINSSRNTSPSHTPQPHRPDLPSPLGGDAAASEQDRRPELMHRASMPAQHGSGRRYDFSATAAYRMRFPQDGHIYAISSRTYQAPIPGPLPEPDFSFGTGTCGSNVTPPSSSEGEGDLCQYTFPPEDGETEDGSAASYDAFSSRFGSIASIADSESSATSARYSEDSSFEHLSMASHSHSQAHSFDQDGRRLSCVSTGGQFLDMFSGLDVDNGSTSSLVDVSVAGPQSNGNGQNHNRDGSGTTPCGSPSSTVSGGSEHRVGDNGLPISQTSELTYALQHVPGRQDDGTHAPAADNNGDLLSSNDASSAHSHQSRQEADAISFVHSHRSSSSGSSLQYPLSASSSSSSLGLPHPPLGIDIPDKFVFDNIEVVSGTGHYSPVEAPHSATFDGYPHLPIDLHMSHGNAHHLNGHHLSMHGLAQHQYPHQTLPSADADDCIQLHDAMEYSLCPPAHGTSVPVDAFESYGYYN